MGVIFVTMTWVQHLHDLVGHVYDRVPVFAGVAPASTAILVATAILPQICSPLSFTVTPQRHPAPDQQFSLDHTVLKVLRAFDRDLSGDLSLLTELVNSLVALPLRVLGQTAGGSQRRYSEMRDAGDVEGTMFASSLD